MSKEPQIVTLVLAAGDIEQSHPHTAEKLRRLAYEIAREPEPIPTTTQGE